MFSVVGPGLIFGLRVGPAVQRVRLKVLGGFVPRDRRIVFFTRGGPDNTSSRCRVFQLVPLVEKAGYECQTIVLQEKREPGAGQLARCLGYNIVFLHNLFGSPRLISALTKLGKSVVIDVDDVSLGQAASRSAGERPGLVESARRANAVICSTAACRAHLQKLGLRPILIPPSVDTGRFRPKIWVPGNSVTIGWSGESKDSRSVFALQPVIAALSRKLPGRFRLKLVGARQRINFGPDTYVEFAEQSLKGMPEQIASFDVGIMPLPSGARATATGCLELLSYMATAIPFVATRNETTEYIAGSDNAGFLVSEPKEWVSRLALLVESEQVRRTMGQSGRKLVCEKFSLSKNLQKYLDLFARLQAR